MSVHFYKLSVDINMNSIEYPFLPLNAKQAYLSKMVEVKMEKIQRSQRGGHSDVKRNRAFRPDSNDC